MNINGATRDIMNKILFGGIVFAALLTAPAVAADLAVKAPLYKAPPPARVFSWTGCYIGVNGGYGWQQDHANDFTAFGPAGAAGPTLFLTTQNLGPTGGFGGGQAGCNYQSGMFVWGVEADIEGSGIRDSFGPTSFGTGLSALTATASEKLKWFGTVRGRLGIAADRALFYVTGGAAFGKTEYSLFVADTLGNTLSVNGDSSRSGYTVGAGIEWAFVQGWTAKAEYQYLNFGDIGPATVPAINRFGNPAGGGITTSSFRNDYHTIRFGLNYLFNAGPVVAKY
jgi:outer membrane immunogenic protein